MLLRIYLLSKLTLLENVAENIFSIGLIRAGQHCQVIVFFQVPVDLIHLTMPSLDHLHI